MTLVGLTGPGQWWSSGLRYIPMGPIVQRPALHILYLVYEGLVFGTFKEFLVDNDYMSVRTI